MVRSIRPVSILDVARGLVGQGVVATPVKIGTSNGDGVRLVLTHVVRL